ncbi:MAG: Uma2 family endonuclease [Lachnospiraceae bacterium]|nr:Uma2 family endonuclease [Lachnospiraceae bacterium]
MNYNYEAKKIQYVTEEEYYSLPEERRCELINGIFYDMSSPSTVHQLIVSALNRAIANHISLKGVPCKVIPAPYDVKLFPDEDGNIVQPDLSIICDRSKIKENRCEGAPDWIIEVASPGNLSHDYITKLKLYRDAGVKEYWIVNPMNGSVQTYLLQDEIFAAKEYSMRENVPSHIISGLSIDFKDME